MDDYPREIMIEAIVMVRNRCIDTLNDIRDHIKRAIPITGYCPECGEYKPDDERVQEGMKCGPCAYGTDPQEGGPEGENDEPV